MRIIPGAALAALTLAALAGCGAAAGNTPAPAAATSATHPAGGSCEILRSQLTAYDHQIKAEQAAYNVGAEAATTTAFTADLRQDATLAPPAVATAENDLAAALDSENDPGVTYALGEIRKACP